jgi:hypothetical protein
MTRVHELREQYEIDMKQIGEAWQQVQEQAKEWFAGMKNKLS